MEVRPHKTTELQQKEQAKYLYLFEGNQGQRNGHTDQQKSATELGRGHKSLNFYATLGCSIESYMTQKNLAENKSYHGD